MRVGRTSAPSPSRHLAAAQQLGRFRREADIKWRAGPTNAVSRMTRTGHRQQNNSRDRPQHLPSVEFTAKLRRWDR
jgi:hypothetical protein